LLLLLFILLHGAGGDWNEGRLLRLHQWVTHVLRSASDIAIFGQLHLLIVRGRRGCRQADCTAALGSFPQAKSWCWFVVRLSIFFTLILRLLLWLLLHLLLGFFVV